MRGLVVACSVLFACSEVTIVPNDGGASAEDGGATSVGAGTPGVGGSGGSGGAPIAEPRFIEVAVADGATGEGVVALLNAADGTLKDDFAGEDLPVNVEVADGDLVSFFQVDQGGQRVLSSYRVTAEVWRVTGGAWAPGSSCEGAPMEITLSLPPVEGASDYVIYGNTFGHYMEDPGTAVVHAACDPSGVVTIFAAARGGYGYLTYELVSLPYEPGGAVALDLTLSDTTRVTIEMHVEAAEQFQALDANGDWRGPGLIFTHESNSLWSSTENGAGITFSRDFIAPGGGTYVASVGGRFNGEGDGDGVCMSADFTYMGFGQTAFEATLLRIAQPVHGDRGAFSFADGGALGDEVWQSFRVEPNPDYNWLVHEDPQSPWPQLVFPELPGDPGSMAPSGPLPFAAIGHVDDGDFATYADKLAGVRSVSTGIREWRNEFTCD